MLEKLAGTYSIRSQPIHQKSYSIEPQHWITVEGYRLPARGPFAEAKCERGYAMLYRSAQGEITLYYHIDDKAKTIYWHEQQLALPQPSYELNRGSILIWSPAGWQTWQVDWLPYPDIRPPIPIERAYSEYRDVLIQAVRRRTLGRDVVAVSQSGGKDSTMVTWALRQAGIRVVPITARTSPLDSDWQASSQFCEALGVELIPAEITAERFEDYWKEAMICLEDRFNSLNTRMGICNIAIARKARELGIDVIYTGHMQDRLFGRGVHDLDKQKGTPSERWRDVRWMDCGDSGSGMLKMWSTMYRRYRCYFQCPFLDSDLLEWALAQPVEVLPFNSRKQFVHDFAKAMLPGVEWQDTRFSKGFASGAGLSMNGRFFRGPGKDLAALVGDSEMRSYLNKIKKLPLRERQALHDAIEPPSK